MNIIFDLDGTLIDSAPDIRSAASGILRDLGLEELTMAETRAFVGEGAMVFVSRMMAARGLEETAGRRQALHDDFIARYELAVDLAEFYPGVLDTLALLRAQGHKLGLCTNKPERPARAVLKHMQLETFLDAVTAGGMLATRKPEPEMLRATIRELGGGPTLYVGDSEIDAETARRADVPFALYSGGYRKSEVSQIRWNWVFSSFGELPGIVDEAARRSPGQA